ncbi:MAG: HNH endonuclease [Syntrophobacteraceae bacterium]|jgi:5-methylcytosine-specific restriction endonuclease McrA|nr:HNH endonuclease [Syntrophobacteraceae bacterium]
MTFSGDGSYFLVSISPRDLKKEKEKARELRRTQWWQRQVARGRCHYCNGSFEARELSMDHVVPLIRGGRSTRGNVVPACKECNNRKKYLLPIEWDEYMLKLKGPADLETGRTACGPEGQGKDDGRV